jgi:hypothetical protein
MAMKSMACTDNYLLKCRCRAQSTALVEPLAAGGIAKRPGVLEVPIMNPLLDVCHNRRSNPERSTSDYGTASSPSAPQEMLAEQTSNLPNFPYEDHFQEQEPFLETQIPGHSLAFTCPFLFMGCKFVAFSCAEWSAHLGH